MRSAWATYGDLVSKKTKQWPGEEYTLILALGRQRQVDLKEFKLLK